LMWARENGCPANKETCRQAVLRKDWKMLTYARDSGCLWDRDIWIQAAENGYTLEELFSEKKEEQTENEREKRTFAKLDMMSDGIEQEAERQFWGTEEMKRKARDIGSKEDCKLRKRQRIIVVKRKGSLFGLLRRKKAK